MAATMDDITIKDVSAFVQKLSDGTLTRDDIHATAVALEVDEPTIDPVALSNSFGQGDDVLVFLCRAPTVLVNAVTNNALWGTVSAGKGVVLRDFLCNLASETKENGTSALQKWESLSTEQKEQALDVWKKSRI